MSGRKKSEWLAGLNRNEWSAKSGICIESKERPVLAQLALLAMQPNDFKNFTERKIFTDLHNDLLDISKYISKKGKTYRNPSNKEVGASINDPFFMKISKPISGLLRIISQFNISDEEIKAVGGISLYQTVHKMKELLN